MKKYTGHLLIPGVDDVQYITPATFAGNGLAIHRTLDDGAGYAVTHVSSGLALRTRLQRLEAHRLFNALTSEDWTFSKDAVTADHAQRVREILEAPQISRGMVAA